MTSLAKLRKPALMKSAVAAILVGALLAIGCNNGNKVNTTGTRLTLAGNSVSRDLFEKGLIPAFKTEYANAHPGYTVDFTESYDGSGAQERAIEKGLNADVAALSLAPEIDKLAAQGLASKDWAKNKNGVPATSVVVMVVRAGNPKNIHDWSDLMRSDIDVVLPNPDTSGAAKWNVAAIDAWQSTLSQATKNLANASPPNEIGIFQKIRARVKAFGKSGKEAMQIFSSGIGDVTVGWESEALDRKAAGDQVDIVYPPTTLEMDPPVAVITPKGQKTNAAAEEFVQFLYTPAAQKIYVEHHYRPTDASVQSNFAAVPNLMKIDQIGGWDAVNKKLFGADGLWDKAAQS